ncbi:uncharacterized protein LOC135213671 [Macrobrachium nipponense]|uniref:uncharacterized protein LOC135213671 n=1 Tax=Macrobrachium nipponense TaxID=159736 RepID=UPI0030C86524
MFKIYFFLFQTSGSEPVPSEPVAHVFKTRKKYCCNCGRKGHYGFECTSARHSYLIQGQSVISYSTPVLEVNGQLVVNLEGALVNGNVTKVEVGKADVQKISGRRDSMMNKISRVTGANLWAYEDNGRSYIQVIGDSGAQTSSYSALETILGYNLWNPQLSPFMKTMSRNRNKEIIISIVRKKISFYNGLRRRLPELPEAVRVLRKGLLMNGSASSTSRFSQRLKEALQLASLIVIGHLKWGEGQKIFQHVTQVLGQIKKLRVREKVPLPIIEDIARKLQKIDSPHIGQLEVILKLAEKYLKKTCEKVSYASKIQRPINNVVDDDVIVLCENGSVENSKVNIEDQREKLINECESSSNSGGVFGNEKSVILSRRIEQTEDVELVHETGNEKLMRSSARNSLTEAGVIGASTSGLVDLPSLGDECQEMSNCVQMKRSGRNKRVLGDETEKLTLDIGTGSLKDENSTALEGVPYFDHKRPKSSDCGGIDSLGFSLSSALHALSEIKSRESVLEILQRTVVYCDSMQSKLPELHDAVSVLKERQKFNSMTKSSPRGFQKKLKAALKLASLLMLGHPKDGEVYHKISELLSQVWLLNSEAHVPEFIIKAIKNSLKKISNPSVKKLDYIVSLADRYITSKSYLGGVNTRMQERADQGHVGSSSITKTLDGEKDDKITFDIVVDDARLMIEKQLLMSTKKRLKCSSEKGTNVNTVLEESFDLGSMKKLLPVKKKVNSGKQKYIRKLNPKEGTVLEKDFPDCVEKILSSSKGKQNKAKNTTNQTPFTSQRFTGPRQSCKVQMLSTSANSLKPKHKTVKNFNITRKRETSKEMEGNSVKGVLGKQFNKKLKVGETDVDSSGLKYPKAKKKRKVISCKLKPKSALF